MEYPKWLGYEAPPESERLARRNDKGNGRTDETLQVPRRRYGVQARKRKEPEGVQGVGQAHSTEEVCESGQREGACEALTLEEIKNADRSRRT